MFELLPFEKMFEYFFVLPFLFHPKGSRGEWEGRGRTFSPALRETQEGRLIGTQRAPTMAKI